MRFLNKKKIFALIILSFYLLSPVASWACTSMLVGKNASTTGRPLFSRSEDSNVNGAKKFIVVPAGFYKAGYHQLDAQGFNYTFKRDSYKYTAVANTTRTSLTSGKAGYGELGDEATSKDALPHWDDGFHFAFDSNGVNEKGLAVSCTTTTRYRDPSATGLDRGPEPRWSERTMAKLLLAAAGSCREAMDVIDEILAPGPNRQSTDNEIIHMADQNEAWLLAGVAPYYYVAIRVPDDSFAAIANAMHTQYFDENDPVNFRSNFKPNTYAEENGFARYQIDEKGVKRVNISLTYGDDRVNGETNTYRRWRGMTTFAPSQGSKLRVLDGDDFYGAVGGSHTKSTDIGATYPSFIKPDKKISPMDIAALYRDRYAGTPFDQTYAPQFLDANGSETNTFSAIATILPPGNPMPIPTPAGNAGIRVIGTYSQQHVHIYDVGGKLPPDIGARFFLAMSVAESSVFLPFYGNITDTHPKHKFNVTAENTATTGLGLFQVPAYDPNSSHLIFSRLGYLARSDRLNYAAPIMAFWREYELRLYNDMEKVVEPEVLKLYSKDKAAASKYITDYTIAASDKAFNAAMKIHDALVAHMAANPNTLFKIPANVTLPEQPTKPGIIDKCEDNGCNAGLAYLAIGIFAILAFMRKRSE
jgi:dipeptidase